MLSLVTNQHIQQGYILQNGLLVGMGVIYLAYPFILIGLKRLKLSFYIFMTLVAAVAILDIYLPSHTKDDPLFINSYTYSWVWIGYYIIGHLLGEKPGREITKKEFSFKLSQAMLIPTMIALYFHERHLTLHSPDTFIVAFLLEHSLLLTLSLVVFVIFKHLNITVKFFIRTIEFISPAMVGVYIVHYSVFNLLYTVYDFQNSRLGFLLTIVVFVVSVLLCKILLLHSLTRRIISF